MRKPYATAAVLRGIRAMVGNATAAALAGYEIGDDEAIQTGYVEANEIPDIRAAVKWLEKMEDFQVDRQ
jgi:hypothetical protein